MNTSIDAILFFVLFYVHRNILSLGHLLSFKIISLKSDFIHIFLILLDMYIAPSRGRQPLGDQIFTSTEMPYHFTHLWQAKCQINP